LRRGTADERAARPDGIRRLDCARFFRAREMFVDFLRVISHLKFRDFNFFEIVV
jgi:hypothetical protein